MEMYVDKLPKNCFECPCFKNDIDFSCGLSDGTKDYFLDDIDGGECPLKSLVEHDKQVRKEVVQEIRDFVKIHKETIVGEYDYQTCDFNETDVCGVYFINQILDQIQGE